MWRLPSSDVRTVEVSGDSEAHAGCCCRLITCPFYANPSNPSGVWQKVARSNTYPCVCWYISFKLPDTSVCMILES